MQRTLIPTRRTIVPMRSATPATPPSSIYQQAEKTSPTVVAGSACTFNHPADAGIGRGQSLFVPFYRPYDVPPEISIALNMLDLNNNPTDDYHFHLRTRHEITRAYIALLIDAPSTLMYNVGISWLAIPQDVRCIQTGTWSFGDDAENYTSSCITERISFASSFASQPKVLLAFRQLELAGEWYAHAQSYDIDTRGFNISSQVMRGTTLASGVVTWIAFPADLPGIWPGSFSVRPNSERGSVHFGVAFRATPQIFTGFVKIDVDNKANLRIRQPQIFNVTTTSFDWELPSWWGTVVNEVVVSYLAIERNGDFSSLSATGL
ncbi:hypothetical protein HGRIS_001829 [Hohenbuehelia grisea]|uniref:H-type lectin domain-containing protein n=1 Tax=Hohenbuehelia grisea TaxID=104357 RepID=A0ABR3JIK5_9AGAR